MGAALDFNLDNKRRQALDAPPQFDRTAGIRAAKAANGGKGWFGKMFKVTRGPGAPNLSEFFYYGLYDPSIPVEEGRRYIGKTMQHRFHVACNSTQWYAAAHDKALFYTVAKGAGQLVPETLAVYGHKPRAGFPRQLSDAAAVGAFLASCGGFPIFAKPIDGMFSIGAFKIAGYRDGRIDLGDGEAPATVEEFCSYMDGISTVGYLFQKLVRPSRFAERNFGPGLPTVRFLVFVDEAPRIASVVVKIPAAGSAADNFWHDGNMLAAVDRDSGVITRAIAKTADSVAEIETCAATGATLPGLQIADWAAYRSCVEEAAALFPGVRTQSWDIAMSAHGPLLMEFNWGGDLNLHQLAHRRGMLTEEYVAHLRACGYKGKLG